MYDLYSGHWDTIRSNRSMRVAIAFSVIAHSIAGYAMMSKLQIRPQKVVPITYEVEFMAPPTPEPVEEEVKAPPPPPPKPKPPEPKVEEKKPEPKPKPKPKPKKVAKKPEPKKEPEKKKEVKKTPPKKKAPVIPPQPPKPPPEVVAKAQPKAGIQQNQLPSVLNAWGRLVQRKVEKYWQVPGGIKISDVNKEVHISFWVDRNGQLLSKPEVVKAAADPELGKSGIRAVELAVPLPPLPNEYGESSVQVIYVFSMMK